MRQTALQPSPLVVLPSSHCSVPSFFLSPQIGRQGSPTLGQRNPTSGWHVAEQPSPEFLFWSSQVSPWVSLPFPQYSSWQTDPVAVFSQEYPVSMVHVEEQPSLFATFPSSQRSPAV